MYGNINYNKFDYLFHEMGHMIDFKTQTPYFEIKNKIKNSKVFEKQIDSMVIPQNAAKNKSEFIAEITSGQLNGDTYPDVIMKLFNKVCNIKISQ